MQSNERKPGNACTNGLELDLNVASPEEVAGILERAADEYRQSAEDLACAWQDNGAGSVWVKLARILSDAAEKCEQVVHLEGARK